MTTKKYRAINPLAEVIQKAVENGWQSAPQSYAEYEAFDTIRLRDFIFDPDFTKALWGNGSPCDYCGEPPGNMHNSPCPNKNIVLPLLWQYHLQQMVISRKPEDYLISNVKLARDHS